MEVVSETEWAQALQETRAEGGLPSRPAPGRPLHLVAPPRRVREEL